MYVVAYKNDVHSINGNRIERVKNSLPLDLNKYGNEGWELVGIMGLDLVSNDVNYWRLVFKRPRE